MRRPLLVLAALVGTVLLIALVTAVPSATGPARAVEPEYAELALTELTPSTVTSSSGSVVHVRGHLTNTFDRPLSDLRIRLRVGGQVKTAVALRTSLMGDTPFPVTTPPHRVSERLDPGRTADFDLEVPLSGENGLHIDTTGVFPLQIDAVGVPESGGAVQVAVSRTLLPVLSLPADAERAAGYLDPGYTGTDTRLGQDGSLAPDDSSPAALTMIWPLADTPQLAPGILGGKTEPVRLLSDRLAGSLAPNGRLDVQLAALERLASDGDGDDRVRTSLCVAVDPDLLVTVHAMTLGYDVTKDPDDPRGAVTRGTGRAAARAWLSRLSAVAQHLCVTALPFAQAGLDSLHTIDDAGLTSTALTSASDVVDSILGVTSLRGVTLPATGTLTDSGRALLDDNGIHTAAIASSSVEPQVPAPSGRYRSGAVALQTYDAPITAALGAAGDTTVVPSIMPGWQQPDLSHESPVSRRQTAVAALAFPMLTVPHTEAGESAPVTGRSAFIMPPTYWSPTADDATALVDAVELLLASGTAHEESLRDVVGQLPDATGRAPLVTPGDVDPVVAQGFPISAADAGQVRANLELSSQLQASLVGSRDTVTTPQAYLAPLGEDALRAVSVPEAQTLDQARSLRSTRIGAVGSTLTRMRQSVALLDPGGRYTLASERSPLLLVVRNDLALPMRVRMNIDAPAVLNVGDVGVQEIPPMGTRQIQIPTHASTSERATVKIALVTSTGVPLNEPITLSIFSNAYGKPLFWITIGAGIALVLLTARRLWHRFRGEPDPADEDRPEPDADELRLAATPYEERLEVAREEHVEPPQPPDREDS